MGAELMREYIEITKSRIESAEKGLVKIRPMDRDIFDPNSPKKNKPPKTVRIQSIKKQPDLFQKNEQLVYEIERLKRHFPAVPVKVIVIDENDN